MRDRASIAARFVVVHQHHDGSVPALSAIGSTADAVLAWVAARRAPRAIGKALDYLRTRSDDITSLGDIAKVALAWLAGGRDPRAFVGRDLVAEIEAKQEPDGRYDATSSVFSHAVAMMVLEGSGGSPTLEAAGRWLAGAQCTGGGWQFLEPAAPGEDANCSLGPADIDQANSDTTALAVQAMESLPSAVPYRHDPIAWLRGARDPVKGGWGYEPLISITNANSTGMVLQAFGAVGIRPPAGAVRALLDLEGKLCGRDAGSFFYSWEDPDGDGTYRRYGRADVAATIAAIPGLLASPWPAVGVRVEDPPPNRGAC
jgi:hypothetical protein